MYIRPIRMMSKRRAEAPSPNSFRDVKCGPPWSTAWNGQGDHGGKLQPGIYIVYNI